MAKDKKGGLSPEAEAAISERARKRRAANGISDEELEQELIARQWRVIRSDGNDYGYSENVGNSEHWQPLDGEYDVEAMNARFAVVKMGSGVSILMDGEEPSFLRKDAFETLFQNKYVEVENADGEKKNLTWARAWLNDRERRQYAGIEFFPDAGNATGKYGFYNLWRGFAVSPRKGGTYSIFRDHLLTNVCGGDQVLFAWLFAWFAQLIQQPREKPGTAVVLRGGMGVGKSKAGEVFGSLLGRHYYQVDDPRYITGNFNVHMSACLLLQAEEAVWAGSKDAEGRLKGLVTSKTQMIEAKGVDPVQLPNFIRLFMTSNENWVIPAGKDERRFAVFDVLPNCANDHRYFRQMDEELDSGGREALLYDLLRLDISEINLRLIPKTTALLSQKINSFDPVEAWLFARLEDGRPTERHDEWPAFASKAQLFDDYIKSAERTGIRRRAAETQFHMRLKEIMPILRPARRTVNEDDASIRQVRGYDLPPLETCRAQFEAAIGQPYDWDA
ncbi:primase-helicase family protein [Martelella sp. AMO21009]